MRTVRRIKKSIRIAGSASTDCVLHHASHVRVSFEAVRTAWAMAASSPAIQSRTAAARSFITNSRK